MNKIIKTKLLSGCFFIEIEDADFRLLCASPADVVKHLIKNDFIKTKTVNDVTFETGPNSILLSDLSVQNYQFSNLSEFPVLQMLYRQGLIIPNHINNTGSKPMIIGEATQIETQLEYIMRGNYGLLNEFEFSNTGLSNEEITKIMDMKLHFSFGNISKSEELFDIKYLIKSEKVEIKKDIFLQRKEINKFVLFYKDEEIEIDLNLTKMQSYSSPYDLEYFKLPSSDFSVIHSGQGDGWSINKTAMSSVLTYKGKIYLVDAPPNIIEILNSLGIGLNDIEGIFHTHAHDDHFVGLTSILLTDHKIKYYSSKVVRHSVMKKLSSLLHIPFDSLDNYFEYVDLELNSWNDIDGLKVKPVLSAHPIETNIFYFKTLDKEGEYKSYAHLADISSFDVLKKMVKENDFDFGITQEFHDSMIDSYLEPTDLKKIDIGGGLIHGDAKDFIQDNSTKIVLAHCENDTYTQTQKSIGSDAQFASVDDLIPSSKNYIKEKSIDFISSFFPNLEKEKYEPLLECEFKTLNPGTIVLNERKKTDFVYLLLSGSVEKISRDSSVSSYLYAGSFLGDKSVILNDIVKYTYRSLGYINLLEIPKEKYINFIDDNNLYLDLDSLIIKSNILNQFWIFDGFLSPKVENQIVNKIIYESYEDGDEIVEHNDGLCLIIDGHVARYKKGEVIATLKPKDYFGDRHILEFKQNEHTYKAIEDVEIYVIPKEVLKNIPIIHWKLFMNFQDNRTVNLI